MLVHVLLGHRPRDRGPDVPPTLIPSWQDVRAPAAWPPLAIPAHPERPTRALPEPIPKGCLPHHRPVVQQAHTACGGLCGAAAVACWRYGCAVGMRTHTSAAASARRHLQPGRLGGWRVAACCTQRARQHHYPPALMLTKALTQSAAQRSADLARMPPCGDSCRRRAALAALGTPCFEPQCSIAEGTLHQERPCHGWTVASGTDDGAGVVTFKAGPMTSTQQVA